MNRRILRLAIPGLGALAIEPLYVLVDTAIVGRLGTTPLGGLALASTVLTTAFGLFNFLAYGVTARVAFFMGADDRRAASSVAAQGIWTALALGVVSSLVLLVVARPLLQLLGGRGAVLDAAVTYLRISAPGVIFVLLALACTGWLRGIQDARTPLVVVLAGNVLNVVLEIALVYGLRLGIAGSAIGTLVAQLVSGVVLVVVCVRGVEGSLRPHVRGLLELWTVGRRLVVRVAALLVALTLATSFAARSGRATLAAHQIAIQVLFLSALLIDGLAIAAQTLIGAATGRGDHAEVALTRRRLRQMGVVGGCVLGAVIVATSPWLPGVFTADSEVVARASAALVIAGLQLIVAADAYVLDGVLIGAGESGWLQWGTLLALVAFVPTALALRTHGIVGIWIGLAVWMVVRWAWNCAGIARRGGADAGGG